MRLKLKQGKYKHNSKGKQTNWSLQEAEEEEFVNNLLADQPFVPAYSPFDVELNKKGAPDMKGTITAVSKRAAAIVVKLLFQKQ